MGKTSKWIKHFLTGKKDKDKEKNNNIGINGQGDETLVVNGLPTTTTVPPTQPGKEKRRWSFRRSSTIAPPSQQPQQSESENKKKALEMAAAAEMKLSDAIQESAAIKIQSFYRGYLSRKALNALRGLVKLQALVRGHLVRKQAAATLRCMQSLIRVQSRARAQRLHMVHESKSYNNQKPINQKKLSYDFRSHSFQDIDIAMEENVKIVEMDHGYSKPSLRSRSRHASHGNGHIYPFEHIISTNKTSTKHAQEISPSPSARTENSVHFEEYSFSTAQSSPQNSSKPQTNHAEPIYREYHPSYMANTQSSKAKVRSQSAPKSRPETYERQSSARRRNVNRGVRMQRSSSHVAAGNNYEYPWSIKLNKSSVSLKASECGSNSTVFTVY